MLCQLKEKGEEGKGEERRGEERGREERGRRLTCSHRERERGRLPSSSIDRDIAEMSKGDISNGGCWFYDEILS